jgi:hypothetical protein
MIERVLLATIILTGATLLFRKPNAFIWPNAVPVQLWMLVSG